MNASLVLADITATVKKSNPASPEAALSLALKLFGEKGFDPFTVSDLSKAVSAWGNVDKSLVLSTLREQCSQNKKGGWFWSTIKPQYWEASLPITIETSEPELDTSPDNSWISQPPANNEFSQDAYLRQVAVEATPCFGKFKFTDPACSGCKLSSWCVSAFLADAAIQGARLDQEAAKHTPAPASKKTTIPTMPPPPVTDNETIVSALIAKGNKAKIMEVTFGSKCSTCQGPVKTGDILIAVTGLGMHHPACAQKTFL